jgi:hypothetical protein
MPSKSKPKLYVKKLRVKDYSDLIDRKKNMTIEEVFEHNKQWKKKKAAAKKRKKKTA